MAGIRLAAGSSLLGAACFVVALAVALGRTPEFSSTDFLSQLGAVGAPAASVYRWAILASAVAAALLGLSVHLAVPKAAAAGYVVAASLMLGTSFVLPCDAGCPIPVVESGGGPANALHFFINAAAFLTLALAMYLMWRRCADRVLRRSSLAALTASSSLMALLAVLLLFATHGVLSATVERVLLVTAFGWLVVTAARLMVRPEVQAYRPARSATYEGEPR
ncbi:MAG: DUF998 domain-containing protein [Mycobacteriales bacterium]